jgi:hypothetical protein
MQGRYYADNIKVYVQLPHSNKFIVARESHTEQNGRHVPR